MSDVYINILQDSKDPHYRYKMPKLTAKVEGSGNGIKTVITNMPAIAKALGRPAAYPTKYFGCELGAQVTMANDYVVNGSHDPDKLLALLYGFIRKFVLCPKCKNPETTLTVVGQSIHQKCIACGHSNTIDKSIHKLTTYIINHPADGSTASSTAKHGAGGKPSSSSKGDKRSKKSGQSSSPTNGNGTHANGDSGNDNNVQGGQNNEDDFDDFDDEELTSAAYKERMRELCDGLNSDMYLSDTKENANIFYELVKEKKEKSALADTAVQKELVAEAERLRIKDKATLILSELLFTENIIDEIKSHRMLLLRFCHENQKAQKYLLGGFEKLVGDVYKDKLFNLICRILKQFYDEDILEEEVIIEWSLKSSKKYVSKDMSKKIHEKAAPFIKWLNEAEEDDESDEDDEEDSDDAAANKKKSSTDTKQAASKQAPATKAAGKPGAASGAANGANGQRRRSLEDDEDDDDGIDLEFSHRVSGITIVETVKPSAQAPKAVNAASAESASTANQAEDDLDIDNI